MDEIRQVTVPAATRAPTGTTHAYVVGRDGAVLVDPADGTDDLDRVVAERSVEHVLVTHTHPDHVGGVADYAGGRTVWAHADHRDRFADATGVAPDRTFRDGDGLPAELEVVETPGHAVDHVAFSVPGPDDGSSREAALVGDLAVAEGSVVVGAPEGDMRAYLDSLRRVRDRDPAALHPAHGPTITDPQATLTRLIDHRLERERSVLAAVEDGAETPDEVTDRAYEKDLTGVRDLAVATVVAHLEKLADDGAIDFDGDRARPT